MHFSDFVVFADESGDHGLTTIDPSYPVFVLVFCLIRKSVYSEQFLPRLHQLKFRFWGHDAVVLHERDIRFEKGPFALLRTDPTLRKGFYEELNQLLKETAAEFIVSVVDKVRLRQKYPNPWNPYDVALHFCLERLMWRLLKYGEEGKSVHVIFESRGHREDKVLSSVFARITNNERHWGYLRQDFRHLNWEAVFLSKLSNSGGLQLADLAARPFGLDYLNPNQENRAMAILRTKYLEVKAFP